MNTLLSPFLELDASPLFFPLEIENGIGNVNVMQLQPVAQAAADADACGGKKGGRKRALRKDRHSKIRTAQGLRDRRMRLSLDVAQEFFDIQDMLGFDKASKTLRWLITAARPAVEELVVAVSGPKTTPSNGGGSSSKSVVVDDSSTSALYSGDKKSDARTAKRTCRRPPAAIARESRIRARARARERTHNKKLMQSVPLESVKEDSTSVLLDHLVAEADEHCSHHQLPVTIFDYSPMSPNGAVSLFHEQWVDMEIMLQGDVQLHTWEA